MSFNASVPRFVTQPSPTDDEFRRPVLSGLIVLLVPFMFSNFLIWIIDDSVNGARQHSRVPQTLPYKYPYLKSTIEFLFNGLDLFSRASQFSRGQSVTRIALVKDDLYLVHGAKSVAEAFRQSSLSVMTAYGIALRHCFGMSQKATTAYLADTSGSNHKPISGSNVKPKDRVAYRTHENLFHMLLDDGLAPLSDRFETCLTKKLDSLGVSAKWVYYPDLLEFFEDNLGTAILEAIFGAALQSQNPGFIRDLWAFDRVVMCLARQLPWFCIPKAHRLRKKLVQAVKKWHVYARSKSGEARSDDDNDADPFWGSRKIRDRNRMLLEVVDQDYDSVASTDLGFIWASDRYQCGAIIEDSNIKNF